MLEKTIEKKVVKKAKELGFLVFKFTSPGNIGVPDRIFISPKGKLFFIEFKRDVKHKLTAIQVEMKERLEYHGQTVHVVYDVDMGLEILREFV